MNTKKTLDILCPQCSTSLLNEDQKCPVCRSPVYILNIPGNGQIEGCLNKDCGWQRWDAIDSGGQKEYIEIKISDTGCGIPREEIAKIFEPFFTTKGQKGTGLGLAVIWGIIDNHNGTVSVDSEINKGTTFTIKIPISSRR